MKFFFFFSCQFSSSICSLHLPPRHKRTIHEVRFSCCSVRDKTGRAASRLAGTVSLSIPPTTTPSRIGPTVLDVSGTIRIFYLARITKNKRKLDRGRTQHRIVGRGECEVSRRFFRLYGQSRPSKPKLSVGSFGRVLPSRENATSREVFETRRPSEALRSRRCCRKEDSVDGCPDRFGAVFENEGDRKSTSPRANRGVDGRRFRSRPSRILRRPRGRRREEPNSRVVTRHVRHPHFERRPFGEFCAPRAYNRPSSTSSSLQKVLPVSAVGAANWGPKGSPEGNDVITQTSGARPANF